MKSKTSLTIISIISLIGILFSGYLTIGELTAKTCSLGGCQQILGLPTCMYGLVMYLVVFVISLLGRPKNP
jgi:ABC-type tungstate transport system substrate-binding protein